MSLFSSSYTPIVSRKPLSPHQVFLVEFTDQGDRQFHERTSIDLSMCLEGPHQAPDRGDLVNHLRAAAEDCLRAAAEERLANYPNGGKDRRFEIVSVRIQYADGSLGMVDLSENLALVEQELCLVRNRGYQDRICAVFRLVTQT